MHQEFHALAEALKPDAGAVHGRAQVGKFNGTVPAEQPG